jgi:hypothetical protein
MQLFLTSELIQAGHVQTRADGYTQRGHRLWHAFEDSTNKPLGLVNPGVQARRLEIVTIL